MKARPEEIQLDVMPPQYFVPARAGGKRAAAVIARYLPVRLPIRLGDTLKFRAIVSPWHHLCERDGIVLPGPSKAACIVRLPRK